MEETSKINPRLDEELKHETASLTHGAGIEAHSRDDLRDQTTDGLPNPAERPDIPDSTGVGIGQHDVDQRAELARAIPPHIFPARRDALVAAAEREFVPGVLLGALRSLPTDREFQNVQEIWVALGGPTER
jgi:hypothetical protein